MAATKFSAEQMTGQNGFSTLTSDERIMALKLAQQIRARRAAICDEVRAGRRTARSIIDFAAWKNQPEADYKALKSLKVRSFLFCLCGIGPAKADQAMADCKIKPGRRLNGIGPVQRARLIAWLEARNIE